jgi:hypothetical protein
MKVVWLKPLTSYQNKTTFRPKRKVVHNPRSVRKMEMALDFTDEPLRIGHSIFSHYGNPKYQIFLRKEMQCDKKRDYGRNCSIQRNAR